MERNCGTGPEHIRALRDSLEGFEFRRPAPEHTDKIVCATEKDVFILEPGISANKVIPCGPDLEAEIKTEELLPLVAGYGLIV